MIQFLANDPRNAKVLQHMEEERSNKGKKIQRLLDARKLLGHANTADVANTAMPSRP
jgi:hypothetical protein